MSQKILLQTILRLQDQIKTGAANFMDVSAEYLKSTGNFLDGSLKNVALEEINKLAPSNVEDLSVIRTENFRTSPQGEGIMSKYTSTDLPAAEQDAIMDNFLKGADRTYAKFVDDALVDLQNASPSEQKEMIKAIIGRKGTFKYLEDADAKKLLNSVEPIDFGQNIKGIYDEAQGPGAGDAMVEALKSPGAKKSKEIMEEALGVTLRGDETFGELMEMKNALKTKEADQGLGSLYPKGGLSEEIKRDDLAGFMREMRKAGIKNEDVMDVAKITDVAEGKRAATTLARAVDMGADTKIKQEFLSELDEKIMDNGPRYFQEEFQGYDSYGELIESKGRMIRNGIVDDLEELGVDDQKVTRIIRYANDVAKRNPYQPEAYIEAIKQDLEASNIKYDMSFWENYISKILELSAKPATRFAGGGLV